MTLQEETRKNQWQSRFRTANKKYKDWETRFQCTKLYEAYEGKQWANMADLANDPPYVTNLIYSTIQVKNAFLLLSRPKYLLAPVPGSSDWSQEFAFSAVQMKEDLLNSIIGNNHQHFTETILEVVMESYFRFGIIEVGYAANWIKNPNASLPEEFPDEHEEGDKPSKQKLQEIPENEKVYFKHISAANFRVGGIDTTYLDRCNWVGYWEYFYKDDLEAVPGLKLPEDINSTSVASDVEDKLSDEEKLYSGDLLKVWHIWDIRKKMRRLVLDSGEELWEEPFLRLPLFDLRWTLRNKGFYPIPPVSQWMSPQREYNEAREQMRSHRRRFTRKFQYVGDTMEPEELNKFESGPDGTLVKVPTRDAISPINNPELGTTVTNSLVVSKDDFNIVSGTSSEARGQADRQTATQANIIDAKSKIRESAEEAKLSRLYELVGREALLVMQERFTEGIWIQQTGDIAPANVLFQEVQTNQATYKYITQEEISLIANFDFRIEVDVVSMSTIRNEDEKRKFIEFVALTNQYPTIALSAPLIRECAYRVGFRNEIVIREMQKMATLAMIGQMTAASQAAQGTVQQMTPPANEEIQQQLEGQIQ